MIYDTHKRNEGAIEPAEAHVSLNQLAQRLEPAVRIHPSAEVSPLATIGAGSQVWNNSQVREHASIGRNCILGKDVYIDFSVRIGDNVKIQNHVSVYHGTTIESDVFVGPGVIFTNDRRPRATTPDGRLKGNDDWDVGEIQIGHGASIGAGAIILPGVRIGRYALVGAGAVVTRDVADFTLVVGTPARPVGYVCVCGSTLQSEGAGVYRCPACHEPYTFAQEDHEANT